MEIIITCPHGFLANDDRVDPEDGHPFDTAACQCAKKLFSTLKKSHAATLHLSNLPRDVCDLNRSQCRDTKFRKKVRQQMRDCAQGNSVLIDVHSFPRDHSPLDVYLFDNASYWMNAKRSTGSFVNSAIIELTVALLYGGITAAYLPNVPRNDIICEAAEHELPGLLIEFAEDLEKKKIQQVCQIVEKWLKGEYVGLEMT